jgi:signal transduction histidine kinase
MSWLDSRGGLLLRDLVIALIVGALSDWQGRGSQLSILPAGPALTTAVVAVVIAVALRRRFPRSVAVFVPAGAVLAGAVFPVFVASYTAASRLGNTRPLWGIAAWSLVVTSIPWAAHLDVVDFTTVALPVIVLVLGFPTMLGLWAAQRRQLMDGLRERADQAELERDLRAASAVAEERTRIARELHDVVAHRVSLIAVQAGAVAMSSNDQAAAFAESVRQTSTTALDEMRELLGVLRRGDHDDPAPLHPVPTLDGTRKLITDAASAGQRVRSDLPAHFPEVPGTTARAIYRLVQESLTNTAKHAPGSEVFVELKEINGELDVRVSNTGGLPAALRPEPPPKSGFGLIGMRERVVLSGGRMSAGPTPEGGFLVTAQFPKGHR